MKDQLVEIAQNPLIYRVLKQVGITPPPVLNRSSRPWQDRMLHDREILVGGRGSTCKYVKHWLADSGASFILSPEVAAEPFADIEHYRLSDLDQIASDHKLNGILFDASYLTTVDDLSALYHFFHQTLQTLPAHARIVLVGADPKFLSNPHQRAVSRSLEGFSRSLAKELGRQGSTVQLLQTCLEPGSMERIGPFLQFFLSDHAAFITGQILRISDQVKGHFKNHLAGSLAGKSALVTGAAQGIGYTISQALAAEGVHVFCLDRPENSTALESLAQQIEGHAISRALGSRESAKLIAEDIKRDIGYCDIVVHNAGITRDRSLKKMDIGHWDQVLTINLQAVMDLTEALEESRLLRDGGRVICLSSISGIAGNFGQTNYSAAKAGLLGFVEAMAEVNLAKGITVNAIAPGFIETPMTAKMPFVMRQVARRMASLSQGGEPQDVADAVCFLASPCSLGLTGSVLRVCGGHIMGA